MNRPRSLPLLAIILLILFGGLTTHFYGASQPAGGQQVKPAQAVKPARFDDADPAVMRITGAAYKIELSKTNGAIVSISDLASGDVLSTGNSQSRLWSAAYHFSAKTADASKYSPDGTAKFSYVWSAAEGV